MSWPSMSWASPMLEAPSRIDQLITRTRAELPPRPVPADLAGIIADGGLVIDTRPASLRDRDGSLPGAHIIERNVLEWRLDPASPDRLPDVTGHDQVIIVACSEGYASSFAAASLQQLGFGSATDLVGGFQAWRAAGLPTARS